MESETEGLLVQFRNPGMAVVKENNEHAGA